MAKKRLTKSEKKTVEALKAKRTRALVSLKGRTEFLIKRSEELISKINLSGVDSYYSISSDIFRIAEDVYRLEMQLSVLKAMQSDLEDIIKSEYIPLWIR